MERLMKYGLHICLMVMMPVFLQSCQKEENSYSEKTDNTVNICVKMGSGNSAVRSSINNSGKVRWEIGDEIFYCTGKDNDVSGSDKFVVQEVSDAVFIPVKYSDGDNYVVFCTKGKSVGNFTMSNASTGVINPAQAESQDGTFEQSHIGMSKKVSLFSFISGTAGAAVELQPIQAFVKFKMSNVLYGDKVMNKITITSSNNNRGYFNAINTSNLEAGIYGLGNTITIDKTKTAFDANKDYYVAIMPRGATSKYTLSFNLYDGTTLLGKVEVPDIEVTSGYVNDIGDLQEHKQINLSDYKFAPTYAAITKYMTKNIWLHVEPSDFTGTVEWSMSGATGKPTVTVSDSYVLDTLSDGLVYRRYTAVPDVTTVKNAAHKEWTPLTITANIKNPGGTVVASPTCKLQIGNFVDLGIRDEDNTTKVLWSYAPVQGVTDDAANKPHVHDPFGTGTPNLYFWGGTKKAHVYGYIGPCGNTTLQNYYWAGNIWPEDGGGYLWRYNQWDKEMELRTEDDICWYLNSELGTTGCRMPKQRDFVMLSNNGVTQFLPEPEVFPDGVKYSTLYSKLLGYEDCCIYVTNLGAACEVSGTININWQSDSGFFIWGRGVSIMASGTDDFVDCFAGSRATPLYRNVQRHHIFPVTAVRYVD